MPTTQHNDYTRFGVPGTALLDVRSLGATPIDASAPPDFIDEPDPLADADVAALEQELDLTRSEAGFWNPMRFLRGPAATTALILGLGLILLLAVHQTVGVLASIASLPVAGQYLAYALVIVGVLFVAYGVFRAVSGFARFRASPRLSARALDQLAARAHLREQSRTQLDKACADLHTILADHPVDTPPGRQEMARLGFKPDEIAAVSRARRTLMAEFGEQAPAAWIDRYRTLFIAPLDDAARRRIKLRAMLVGAKSAAVPAGALDTAIVLAHSSLLVGDLCRIYRVRADKKGVVAITWQVLLGSFIAGRLDELTDQAAGHLGDLMAGASGGVLAKAGSAIAGKVVGKAAEGVVNAAFCYRLGTAAARRLRPID
jgi:uncharacterized membrane protein YcjF (UPF0283 family)